MKHTIQNSDISLTALSYGATVQQLRVRDRNGKDINVVLGFGEEDDYLHNPSYIGASIGRYAGRIGGGGFTLNGTRYELHQENGVHLHGGENGLNKKDWQLEALSDEGDHPSITYSTLSPHLEEGYPGNLKVTVTYRLEGRSLKVTYKATSDRDTVINLTNHAYFNLNGKGAVLDHELKLSSGTFVELDGKLLPTGNFRDVAGTAYDFRSPAFIGQQPGFSGIDDVFVLDTPSEAAVLYAPETGIEMKVATNQRAVVVYTPEDLGALPFAEGAAYGKYSSICFEAQTFPDAPNQPAFPSAVLRAGDTYCNETVFEFSIR
ncbi:aldose epimerase family protein [Sinomicrobium soli]|uniref:aldose epimerase family protein n=1 Tax=Sinomicrobium sp. N-1-3-6 TaxID=2219864 RepID=UPI0013751BE4|nr:aldose epimerase family protein [Sinomicrobium sp. N-1-3-6]